MTQHNRTRVQSPQESESRMRKYMNPLLWIGAGLVFSRFMKFCYDYLAVKYNFPQDNSDSVGPALILPAVAVALVLMLITFGIFQRYFDRGRRVAQMTEFSEELGIMGFAYIAMMSVVLACYSVKSSSLNIHGISASEIITHIVGVYIALVMSLMSNQVNKACNEFLEREERMELLVTEKEEQIIGLRQMIASIASLNPNLRLPPGYALPGQIQQYPPQQYPQNPTDQHFQPPYQQ